MRTFRQRWRTLSTTSSAIIIKRLRHKLHRARVCQRSGTENCSGLDRKQSLWSGWAITWLNWQSEESFRIQTFKCWDLGVGTRTLPMCSHFLRPPWSLNRGDLLEAQGMTALPFKMTAWRWLVTEISRLGNVRNGEVDAPRTLIPL